MTAVEGNASVYQVNPVRESRITGEGRAVLQGRVHSMYSRTMDGKRKYRPDTGA